MVFNATFNNISAISWRLVLLVKEIRVPRENHLPAALIAQVVVNPTIIRSRPGRHLSNECVSHCCL
jgi:hypothetical protein